MTGMSWKLVAAGVIAAGAIAGCGGSDDDKAEQGKDAAQTTAQQAADPTAAALEKVAAAPPPKQGSPERAWARELCGAMTKAGTPLTQPAINSSNTTKAQRSLVRFLGQVNDQLGTQLQALKQVGAPPIKGADADWERTVGGMTTVRQQMSTVKQEMQQAKVDDSKDLKKLMEQMGQQMTALGTYRGPVASLAADPKIGPAVQAEASCRKFI